MRQPHRGKGEHAARSLLALMEGRAVTPVTVLDTELVVRSRSSEGESDRRPGSPTRRSTGRWNTELLEAQRRGPHLTR